MLSKYFIVWSIIPLVLLSFTLWGLFKSRYGRKVKEPVGFYFKQFLFSFLLLLLSEFLLGSGIFKMIDAFVTGIFPEGVLSWLLYPLLLLGAAQIFKGEKQVSNKSLREKSKKKPMNRVGR